MHISRIQIEEGFLDGLDVDLAPGLNAIIGARGTGKTSLIELLRFGLGVPSYTSEAAMRSQQHAEAVLASGQIAVTLQDDGAQINAIRSVGESEPRETHPFDAPLIFSQTEVETLGVHAPGRLRLLDGFASEAARTAREIEGRLVSEISSLTRRITDSREEIGKFENDVSGLSDINRDLEALRPAEQAVSQASEAAAKMAGELRSLTDQTAQLGVLRSTYDRFIALNQQRQLLLADLLGRWGNDENPADPDPALGEALARSNGATQHLYAAATELKAANAGAVAAKDKLEAQRVAAEEQARALRQQIEAIQEGAGQTVRRVQHLRERAAHLISLRDLVEGRRKDLANLIKQRADTLDRLEAERDRRFTLRKQTADGLNQRLGPRIKIVVERAGQSDAYAGAIATALRGSGLRYNDLSQSLAKNVSPRELMEWAETDDIQALADAAGLPRDRAARALSGLREADLSALGTLLVEDDVQFFLLDGADYKPVGTLSTGQRCTVVLSIILERRDTVIIVDQPEDHIDNAFITETLVKAIADRASEGQIILSTHNANIPVLGNAARVIQMGSDGKRGYALVNAPLFAGESVAAITSVMEGGREAFQRRADFYENHAR